MQALRRPEELLAGCGLPAGNRWAPHDVRFSDMALVCTFLCSQHKQRGNYRIGDQPRWVWGRAHVLALLQNRQFVDNAHSLLERFAGQRALADPDLEQGPEAASEAVMQGAAAAAQLFPQLAGTLAEPGAGWPADEDDSWS